MKRTHRRAILAVAVLAGGYGISQLFLGAAGARPVVPAPQAAAVLQLSSADVPVISPAPVTLASADPLVLPADPLGPDLDGRTGMRPQPVIVPRVEDAPAPGLVQDAGPLGLPCDTVLTVTPAAGATVFLTAIAPCRAGEVVSLIHGGLRGDYRLSPSGEVMARFPAFDPVSAFLLRTVDGQEVRAEARVPTASGFERVVTMWNGADRLSIHAYEFGAEFGAAGHVWSGAPSAGAVAESGRGGFLLSIGDAALTGAAQAEVYSFPAAESARDGAVRIEMEAAVTGATCGRDLHARTLQIGPDLPGVPVDVVLAMPDCAETGGFLVLKNLAQDLMIAAR